MNYTIQLKKKSDKAIVVVYRKSNDKLVCLGSITEINILNNLLGNTFKNLGIDDTMTLEDSMGKQLETMPLGIIPDDLKLENSI